MLTVITSTNRTGTTLVIGDPETGVSRMLTDSHPAFEDVADIVRTLDNDTSMDEIVGLVDNIVSAKLGSTLRRLSDHITVDESNLYWDGERVDTVLSRHVLRMVRAGETDYRPIIAFMERLSANPSQRARISAWAWLNAQDFTLTEDGMIVGYKAVRRDGFSIAKGNEVVLVDGVEHRGSIPNRVGSLIEMDRDLIDTSRDVLCSVGLHVGTHAYAEWFGRAHQGILVHVRVDPADIVSVPKDHDGFKMRVCRYRVIEVSDQRWDVPTYRVTADDDDEDDEW